MKFKKIISLILAVILICSTLAGCSLAYEANAETSTSQKETTTVTTTETEKSDVEETETNPSTEDASKNVTSKKSSSTSTSTKKTTSSSKKGNDEGHLTNSTTKQQTTRATTTQRVVEKIQIEAPKVDYAYYSGNSYAVKFNTVDNATHYFIYRAEYEDGNYTHIGTSTTNSYNDNSANLDKIYYYKVQAYNSNHDSSSSFSNSVKTPVDTDRTHWEYKNATTSVDINKKTTTIDGNKVVYWVAKVSTSNPNTIKTAFAGGSFNSCLTSRQTVNTMARNNGAILAVNGDACGYRNINDGSDWNASLMVRNGKLCYPVQIKNETLNSTKDIGVKTKGGKFYILDTSTLTDTSESYITQTLGISDTFFYNTYLIKNGSIKPYLIGNTGYGKSPSTAIGQTSGGTWIYIVADGRGFSGSAGASMPDMANLMKSEGAYNAVILDGGGSSEMWFAGSKLNAGGSRAISDIAYVKA